MCLRGGVIASRKRRLVGLAAGLGVAYFALWPVPAQPVAWAPPPSPGFTGPFASNEELAGAELLDVGGEGPEDAAVAPDGTVYTGLLDGRIVRLVPGRGGPVTFAQTGGRPLGLRFDGEGRLLVADSRRGLLSVGTDGAVRALADSHAGVPFRLTDDLDVGADGAVYFTDASTRFSVDDSVADVVEHRATGRLLSYDPRRGATRVLLDGLCFANGVALAPDESFVLVAETACYRVRRLWLRGPRQGASEVWIDGLPAFPDGIMGDGSGTFWLALVSPRNRLLDALHPHPALKKALLRVPAPVRPGPKRHGFVLGIDAEGRVRRNLQDAAGGRVAFVTNAVPSGGWLYLGMLHGHALARVAMAKSDAREIRRNWQGAGLGGYFAASRSDPPLPRPALCPGPRLARQAGRSASSPAPRVDWSMAGCSPGWPPPPAGTRVTASR